jgi:ribosome-associated heat shock protein Hsp15
MLEGINEIRIDKFLWAVRLFKTRSIASEACKGGKVKINEHNVKASKDVKVGDSISVSLGIYTKTVKVKALLVNRVGAPLVPNYIEDLTSKEEYAKLEALKDKGFEWRDRGIGRPTKKDRREIKRFKD